jgi:hypothetical protein
MNIFSKLKNLIPKLGNKKDVVIIKSKFGIPTVRVCSVVLVDSGTNPCTLFSCSNDGSCPCFGTYDQGCPINNPFCPVGDNTQCPTFGVAVAFRDDLLESQKNNNSKIFFAGNSLDFKNSIISLNGIKTIVFGKVYMDLGEAECTCVEFDQNIIGPIPLIKIYQFVPGIVDKKIFCDSRDQIKVYQELLNSSDISMPVLQFNYFES